MINIKLPVKCDDVNMQEEHIITDAEENFIAAVSDIDVALFIVKQINSLGNEPN